MSFSFNAKTQEKQTIKRALCPSCQQIVSMKIIQTYLQLRIMHIPTFKFRPTNIAVCQNCFAKFIPNKNALKSAKTGNNALVWHDQFAKYNQLPKKLY